MTRKNYQAIAKAIKDAKYIIDERHATELTDEMRNAAALMADEIIYQIGMTLAADNARFELAKFAAAAGATDI